MRLFLIKDHHILQAVRVRVRVPGTTKFFSRTNRSSAPLLPGRQRRSGSGRALFYSASQRQTHEIQNKSCSIAFNGSIMKELWGADKLEAQLEAAKDDLRDLEKNIRKILGRDVPDGENGTAANASPRVPQKRPLQEDRRRQPADFPNNGYGLKRRWQGGNNNNTEPKTVFSRLSARVPSTADDSGDEDDTAFKPAVSSRVIATPREIPSRQDVIRRESTDERSRQRNRRMFGALLGTLQKFRQEETKLKAKEDKKAEVEARVEEAKRREREELKRERQQLFLNRKQQLAQVKALETKLTRSKQYQEWRSAQIPLLNFIKTKTHPPIYYLPKRSTPETDTLLQESSNELKAEIDRREKALIEELEIIQAQVGNVKNMQDRNLSNSDIQDHSLMEEHEEEENRDPHPDKNGDSEMTDVERSFEQDETIKNKENNSDEEKNNEKEDKEDSRIENNEDHKEKSSEGDKEESREENIEDSRDEDKEEREEDSGELTRKKNRNKHKKVDVDEDEDEDVIDNRKERLNELKENDISMQEDHEEKMDESTD